MSQKHDHYGHRSRLRNRVRKEGVENFEEHQILELLLSYVIPYKDTNPIGHRLINKFGSLQAVLDTDEEELMKVDEIGEVTANFLTTLPKIFSYYEQNKKMGKSKLISPNASYEYIKKYFKGKSKEEIYLMLLTPSSKIIRVEKLAEGTTNEVNVTIREISDVMHKYKVSNVIIAHNHPEGENNPSKEDDQFTKALVMFLSLNSSYLVDHIVIGEDGYYSYRNAGLIEKYKDELSGILKGNAIKQNEAYYEVDDD